MGVRDKLLGREQITMPDHFKPLVAPPRTVRNRAGRPRKFPLPEVGTRYGYWEVLAFLPRTEHRQRLLKVRCTGCGTETTRYETSLTRGATKSCGCMKTTHETFWNGVNKMLDKRRRIEEVKRKVDAIVINCRRT